MKFNTPLPQSLPKECSKAAKIFLSFVDNGNNGLDGVIPRNVLESAKGFAIFTIFKAGFVFSARAGSGIVIARLDDGNWSAPSAIGTAGLGVGGQAGAEMTDFLVVLNSRSAVKSFMSAGSLTLGGNVSVAVGPLGRNGEASGSLSSRGNVAATYSYSKTRGLFGGLSIEGSVIVERQDANVQAYNAEVTAKQLLSGAIERPQWSESLVKTLEACTGVPGVKKWVDDQPADPGYAFGGVESPHNENGSSSRTNPRKMKKDRKQSFPPDNWGKRKDSGSYFSDDYESEEPAQQIYLPSGPPKKNPSQKFEFETHFDSDFMDDDLQRPRPKFTTTQSSFDDLYGSPAHFEPKIPSARPEFNSHYRSQSAYLPSSSSKSHMKNNSYPSTNPFDFSSTTGSNLHSSSLTTIFDDTPPYVAPKPELTKPLLPHEGVARAVALYDFNAVEDGDLSFSKGQVITITKKSGSSDDWWTGKVDGRKGIFPANFVEVV